MNRFRAFLGSQILVAAGLWGGHVLNIAFYFLVLRVLPAPQTAEVLAFLSFSFLLGIGQTAMQNDLLLLAQHESLGIAVRRALHGALLLALTLAALLASVSPFLRDFLRFPSVAPFVLLGLMSAFSLSTGVLQGVLIHRKKFGALALTLVCETAARLPIGAVLFHRGYQPADTGWILFLSAGFVFLCTALLVRKEWPSAVRRASSARKRGMAADRFAMLPIMLSSLLLALSLRMDVLWVKHSLPSGEVAVYALLSLIATFLFFGTSSVAKAALSYVGKRPMRIVFVWSAVLFLACTGTALLLFWSVGDLLISVLFGPVYTGHIPALLLLLAAVGGYCIINFSFQWLSVRGDKRHILYSLSLVAVQGTALALFGDSLLHVAFVDCCVMAFFAVLFGMELVSREQAVAPAPSFPSHVAG
jgi:O-antigen/teichoic acid export membrane protein